MNPNFQDQQIMPFGLEKDTETVEEPQAQNTQHIPSMNKVEGAQESTTQKANIRNGQEILEVQKET
jgi:hypothetical protein